MSNTNTQRKEIDISHHFKSGVKATITEDPANDIVKWFKEVANRNTQRFFTIEVYNRRKWSDKYSCIYSTLQEAEERVKELYEDYKRYQNNQDIDPIHTCYRIKENIITEIIHELQ